MHPGRARTQLSGPSPVILKIKGSAVYRKGCIASLWWVYFRKGVLSAGKELTIYNIKSINGVQGHVFHARANMTEPVLRSLLTFERKTSNLNDGAMKGK